MYYQINRLFNNTLVSGINNNNRLSSIWSILIGWSLLNRDNKTLIRNNPFENIKQINSIEELYELIKKIACKLLNLLNSMKISQLEFSENLVFTRGELEILIIEFSKPTNSNDKIYGKCHFQIMSLLMNIQIQIKNNDYIDCIGSSLNDVIRISLDNENYNVYNNKKNSNDISHFNNKLWWNKQWNEIYEPICSSQNKF